MNIFGIGLPEMILIFIVALLIFGPKKLPEIGRTLAKTLRSFQEASREFESELKREAVELEKVTRQESMVATLEKVPPQALSPASLAANGDTPPTPELTIEAAPSTPQAPAPPSSHAS